MRRLWGAIVAFFNREPFRLDGDLNRYRHDNHKGE